MRSLLLIGLLAVALTWLPAPALAETPLRLKVVTEPAQVETLLGDRFMITTEITNTGATPTGEILAHLNVATSRAACTSIPRIGRRIVVSSCLSSRARKPEARLGDTGRQCRPLCRVCRHLPFWQQGGWE